MELASEQNGMIASFAGRTGRIAFERRMAQRRSSSSTAASSSACTIGLMSARSARDDAR
jgi:hypothetical protein